MLHSRPTPGVLIACLLTALLCAGQSAGAADKPSASSRALVVKARKAAAGGDTVLAIQIYRDAMLAVPPNIDAFAGLANLQEQIGGTKNARELWQRVIEIDPNFLDAYMHVGFSDFKAGNFASAVDYFQQCAERAGRGDPHYAQAQQGLDAIMEHSPYYRLKIIKARAERLQEALDTDAETQKISILNRQVNLYHAMITQGRALFMRKHYQEAMDSFDLALQLAPGDGEAVKLRQAADMALHQETNNALTDTAINNLLSSRNP